MSESFVCLKSREHVPLETVRGSETLSESERGGEAGRVRERRRESGREKESVAAPQEGRCKATWKREFKLPWREAGPPQHHDDKVDLGQ